jgi:hypothetical protein
MITCDGVSIHRAVDGRGGGYNRIVVERRNIDENLARVFAVNAHSSVKKSSLCVRVSARAWARVVFNIAPFQFVEQPPFLANEVHICNTNHNQLSKMRFGVFESHCFGGDGDRSL